MKVDMVLDSIAEALKHLAVTHLVETTLVPDFNKMYELYDPWTVFFFFSDKHIRIGLGTGNNQMNRPRKTSRR